MPSGAEGADGFDLVFPRRFFALKSSSLPSSYQFDCLVASLPAGTGTADVAVGWSSTIGFRIWLSAEEAVTTAFLRLRLILRPCSSSEETKLESESESAAGGGVAAFLRRLDFALAERFLKANCGTSAAVSASSAMMVTQTGQGVDSEERGSVDRRRFEKLSSCRAMELEGRAKSHSS